MPHAKQAPIDLAAFGMLHFHSVGESERIMKNHKDEKPLVQIEPLIARSDKEKKLAAALKRNLLRRKASQAGSKPDTRD